MFFIFTNLRQWLLLIFASKTCCSDGVFVLFTDRTSWLYRKALQSICPVQHCLDWFWQRYVGLYIRRLLQAGRVIVYCHQRITLSTTRNNLDLLTCCLHYNLWCIPPYCFRYRRLVKLDPPPCLTRSTQSILKTVKAILVCLMVCCIL
jgi:hypothetical protein